MELRVKDRIVLLQILPKEGNFLTFKSVRELRDKLHFSEQDDQDFGIEEEDGQVKWSADKDVPREFTFSKMQREVVEKALTDLEKQNKLDDNTFDLYAQFVEGEEQ